MIKIKDDLIIKTCMESHSMIEASEKLGVSIRWLKNKSKQLDCWNPNVGGKGKIKFPEGHPNKIFNLKDWNEDQVINIARAAVLTQIKKYNLLPYECFECGLDEWNANKGDVYLQMDAVGSDR